MGTAIKGLVLLVVLPFLLVGLAICAVGLYTELRQQPVLYWTLVVMVGVFGLVLFPIATYNEMKRRREIREFNARNEAAKIAARAA